MASAALVVQRAPSRDLSEDGARGGMPTCVLSCFDICILFVFLRIWASIGLGVLRSGLGSGICGGGAVLPSCV